MRGEQTTNQRDAGTHHAEPADEPHIMAASCSSRSDLSGRWKGERPPFPKTTSSLSADLASLTATQLIRFGRRLASAHRPLACFSGARLC